MLNVKIDITLYCDFTQRHTWNFQNAAEKRLHSIIIADLQCNAFKN